MKKITSLLFLIVCGLYMYAQQTEVDYTNRIINAHFDSVAVGVHYAATTHLDYPKHPDGAPCAMTIYVTIKENEALKIGVRSGNKKGDGSVGVSQYSLMNGFMKFDNFTLSKLTSIDSSDATLADITLNVGDIVDFSPLTTTYNVVLPTGTAAVTPRVTTSQPGVRVSGAGEVNLTSGSGKSVITVTALDGIATQVYTINYTVDKDAYRYNLLELLTYTADSGFDAATPIYNLWDGGTGSGVNDTKATGNVEAWVEFDFGREEEIAQARLFQDHAGQRVTDWKVMYWTGSKWEDVFPYLATTKAGWQTKSFDAKAQKVRFYAKCSSGGFVSIHEIQLFTKPSAEQKKVIISCVGDSNTEGAGSSIRGKYAWPFQLGWMLGIDYQVINCGLGGTTLLRNADKPWVDQPQYTKHKESNSNISIIALGTNDTRAVNWAGSAIFKSDYVNLIQEFQNYPSHPEVIIFVPIRNFNNPVNDQITIDQVRPTLRAISKEYGIGMIDGYATTQNMQHLMPDGVHANDEGFKIIAQTVRSVLLASKPVIVIDGIPSSTAYAEYRWYRNGTLISGATGSSYVASQPGVYKVAVKLSVTTDDIVVSKEVEVAASGAKLVVSDETSTSAPVVKAQDAKVVGGPEKILIDNAAGAVFYLYDIYGRMIKADEIEADHASVDVSCLPSGVYVYRVKECVGKVLR